MAIFKNLYECPITLFSKVPTRTTWLADSACNVFISNDRTDFKNLHDLHQRIPVTVADNRKVYASKGGTITLRNTSGQVNITEVIYVPKAPYSLFSIGAGVKQGFISQFTEHEQKLIIHKDNFHLVGNLSENLLYELHTAIGTSHALSARTTTKDTSSPSKISAKRLHIHVGHPSSTIMRSIPGTKQVNFDSSRCEVCILSKMRSSSHDQSTKAEDIFELLHLDLWGPESIELDGCKYWVGITNRKSGYRWVAGLRTKHATGVQTIFAKFKAQAKLETGKKIKRIHVDEGTEFLKEMKRDWEQMEIKYEPTAAYSLELNGKAEVQNRILINTVRAMLKQANMPSNFWLQALETAIYIWNRLPSTALPSKISPFQAYYDKAPRLDHIRTFGCIAYIWLDLAQREDKNKLLDRALKTCLIGHHSEHLYRVYSSKTKRIRLIRDIKFIEDCFFAPTDWSERVTFEGKRLVVGTEVNRTEFSLAS